MTYSPLFTRIPEFGRNALAFGSRIGPLRPQARPSCAAAAAAAPTPANLPQTYFGPPEHRCSNLILSMPESLRRHDSPCATRPPPGTTLT